jgi:uncharacterized protein
VSIQKKLKEKRTEILSIAHHHGVIAIKIFGSVARNEDSANSDIDFIIETGKKRTPFFPGGFISDLEALLECRVDVVTVNALHWFIRDRVLKEAIPL